VSTGEVDRAVGGRGEAVEASGRRKGTGSAEDGPARGGGGASPPRRTGERGRPTGTLTPFDECAQCGTSLATGRRRPVYSERDATGRLRLYSFCDERCRRLWIGRRKPRSDRD
jgi:hypothetical protein